MNREPLPSLPLKDSLIIGVHLIAETCVAAFVEPLVVVGHTKSTAPVEVGQQLVAPTSIGGVDQVYPMVSQAQASLIKQPKPYRR